MEIRHLRYFVAVAEELHFGRAALKLHIAQPPLSMQIRQLENELGVSLFHRTSHQVLLTEAGKAFLDETRAILAQLEEACRTTQRIGRGEVGYLRLGFIDSAVYEVLPVLLQQYRTRYPEVEMMLRQMSSKEQIDALCHNQLDLGILRPPLPDESLEAFTIRQEPFVVVLPLSHPLAQQKDISLSELKEEPFILFTQQIKTDFVEQVRRLCQQAGFEPQVVQDVQEMQTLIGLVSAGFGVSLVVASTHNLLSRGVAYRPIRDATEDAELILAWRRHDTKETLQAFLHTAKNVQNS
ncbi:MAG TPA: LysR family transcriptional regulator [Ktedonobacter sp.]|nr:LysR family transcriptional regulator [Ktedonobacter sp.]